MGRRPNPKDATKIKLARTLGISEQEIMQALGIKYAWYRRCYNEDAGLSVEEDVSLTNLIASRTGTAMPLARPYQQSLNFESVTPIKTAPDAPFDLRVLKVKDEQVWMVEVRRKLAAGSSIPPNYSVDPEAGMIITPITSEPPAE